VPDPFLPGVFNPIEPKLPLGPFGIVLGIVQFIAQLLGFGSIDLRPITSAINNTWANLAVGAAFLYNTLGTIFDFIKKIFSIIYNALKHIIVDVLHGHLLQALKDIQKLFHDLHTLFKPILDAIQWLRDKFYKYIYPWIRHVQQVLAIVRVILSALRLLGVKWAAKLDQQIGQIQGYVTDVLQGIVGTLNQASTWLNFALDPLGIIRRDFFSNSLFSSALQVRNTIDFGKDRYLTASEAQNTHDDVSMAGGGAAVLTRNTDGSVSYSAASQRINDGYKAAWNSYGGPNI
jgi:hypothetical protein